MALFLALAAHPLVSWLERHGVRRGLAVPLLGVVTGILHRVAAFITVIVLAACFLAFGQDLFNSAMLWGTPRKRVHWYQLTLRIHRTAVV